MPEISVGKMKGWPVGVERASNVIDMQPTTLSYIEELQPSLIDQM